MAKINWTDHAREDLNNIIGYLAAQSETVAKVRVQKIISKIDLLQTFPNIGRVVPELEYKNVREIIISNYRIVYHIVSDERIDILTIHHSSRFLDIKKL